jgi:hypothetical protein
MSLRSCVRCADYADQATGPSARAELVGCSRWTIRWKPRASNYDDRL